MKPYTVGDRPLDDQQMAAAMDDGPTKLVIAGAGTGKTTTLVGRLKHLRDEDVDPNGILVISLTNASVDDLRRKISSEMPGYRPDVMTIHALGNRILKKRPMVGTDRAEMIGNILGSLVSKDRRAANAMLLHVDGMRRSGSSDLSYSGATIRNRGLRNISDILFECGIGSVYNPPSYSGKEPMPAFIEVDDGKGHRFKLHQDDPPVISAGKKPEEGWAYLDSRGLDMDRMGSCNLASAVLRTWGHRIPESFGSLISRCKSTGTSIVDLRTASERLPMNRRTEVIERLWLLDRVWDIYTLQCLEKGLTDYDDMVIQGAQSVRAGRGPGKVYTHVLIDEYQDVSRTLVELVKALRETMGFDLFCVGDDWQSIYSFSGGDVWQMVSFEHVWDEWGEVSVHRIERTYRSPQQIVDMASRFIRKNANQLTKEIKGTYSPGLPPISLVPVGSDREIARMIANRLENLDREESVFVIGRTRNDIYALGNGSGQFGFSIGPRDQGSVEVMFRTWDDDVGDWKDDRTIRFITAHSSKGLEADNVFLLADREKGGFPSQTSDDISDLFSVHDEGIDFAEERRVFYVAMTRARRRLFMVNLMEEGYAISSESPFMQEIIADNGQIITKSTPFCSECYGPMRIINVKGRRFYGCCDYPSCRCTKPFYGL